jgi:predicted RNA-binding Zn-ribbon protein involved in translation (DUF1610 family)
VKLTLWQKLKIQGDKKFILKGGLSLFSKLLKIKNKQTTFCYCPQCHNELISSNSFISDEAYVTYKCVKCNKESKWYFDTPVPILIND